MGGRQSKRSVDITTTPKKEGIPAEGGVVGDAAAPGDGKLERIEEADSKPTTNGIVHTDVSAEDKEKDQDEATEKDKEKQSAEEVKAEETKQETSGESPAEAAEVTTPTEATPAGANIATSPDSKETKKKDKMKKKWSFRSISFSKKDKSKPAREDAPKNGDVTKEEPLAEGGEEAENATVASPTEDKSAASSPTESENASATESAPVTATAVAATAVEAKEEAAPLPTTEAATPAGGSPTEEKKEEPTPSAPSPVPVEDKKEDVEKVEPERAVEVSPAADDGDLDHDHDDDVGDDDDRMKPVEGPVEVSVFRVQPVATSSIIERKTSEDHLSQSPSHFTSQLPSSPPPTPIDPSPLQQAQQAAASATALAEALKLPAEAADKEHATLTLPQHSSTSPTTSTTVDNRASSLPTDNPERALEPILDARTAFTFETPPASTVALCLANSKPTSENVVESPLVVDAGLQNSDDKVEALKGTEVSAMNEVIKIKDKKMNDEQITETQSSPLVVLETSHPHIMKTEEVCVLNVHKSQLETMACPLPKKDDVKKEMCLKPVTDDSLNVVTRQIIDSPSSNVKTVEFEERNNDRNIEACSLENTDTKEVPKSAPSPVAFVKKDEIVEEVKKPEITNDSSPSKHENVNVETSVKNASSISNIDNAKTESESVEINITPLQGVKSEEATKFETSDVNVALLPKKINDVDNVEQLSESVTADNVIPITQETGNAELLSEVIEESIEIRESTEAVREMPQSFNQEPVIEPSSSTSDMIAESEESLLLLSEEILVEAKPAVVIPEDETVDELAHTNYSKADNTESVKVIVKTDENEKKMENEPEFVTVIHTAEIPVSDEATDETSLQDDSNIITETTTETIVLEKLSEINTVGESELEDSMPPPLPASPAPHVHETGDEEDTHPIVIESQDSQPEIEIAISQTEITIEHPLPDALAEVQSCCPVSLVKSVDASDASVAPLSLNTNANFASLNDFAPPPKTEKSPPESSLDDYSLPPEGLSCPLRVVPSEDIKIGEPQNASCPWNPAEIVLTPPRSPSSQSALSIISSTGTAATTRNSSQTQSHDDQSNREFKTESVSLSLNSYDDSDIELKERLASPADTVEESLSGCRRRLSNDVSVGAVQEYHQNTPEVEAPVENSITHEVSTTESVDEAPKIAPPAVPIEVPISPPSAPAITEDVASVTKAIEEIIISDKAVAAAVTETIECVNTNEIIADAHHQNNINE